MSDVYLAPNRADRARILPRVLRHVPKDLCDLICRYCNGVFCGDSGVIDRKWTSPMPARPRSTVIKGYHRNHDGGIRLAATDSDCTDEQSVLFMMQNNERIYVLPLGTNFNVFSVPVPSIPDITDAARCLRLRYCTPQNQLWALMETEYDSYLVCYNYKDFNLTVSYVMPDTLWMRDFCVSKHSLWLLTLSTADVVKKIFLSDAPSFLLEREIEPICTSVEMDETRNLVYLSEETSKIRIISLSTLKDIQILDLYCRPIRMTLLFNPHQDLDLIWIYATSLWHIDRESAERWCFSVERPIKATDIVRCGHFIVAAFLADVFFII